MTRAFIGLGGNLGDVVSHFRAALTGLNQNGCAVEAVSRLYRSTAWLPPGVTEPAPDYWNAACCVSTRLTASTLLARLHTIESAAGRTRDVRWGSRILDLDLLLYSNAVIDQPGLKVPHPELAKRPFVLLPLGDLDPTLSVPGTGATVAKLLAQHPQPCPGVWLEAEFGWSDASA